MPCSGDAAILGARAKPGALPYVIKADGLTPWHPEVREKVRLDNEPERVGTVMDIDTSEGYAGPPYDILWHGGMSHWCHLSALRPFCFAPPEPEEEKPEFDKGELVVDTCGWLRIATGGHDFLSLMGAVSHCSVPPYRCAKVQDVANYLHGWPDVVLAALRAHGRCIAKAERPSGEAGK